MKLFELMPQKLSDLLPPTLNQDVPPPIDQIASQVIEAGKIAGFAGIGLAIKTRDFAKDTLNELIAIGEEAMGEQSTTPVASSNNSATEENTVQEEPKGPSLEELFQKASEDVKTLNKKPDNATLGELYALFKQGTIGDATGKRPGITKVAERYKFDAWSRKQGMDRNTAKEAYINKVEALLTD